MPSQRIPTIRREVREARRTERNVEHIVEQIERAALAHHPSGTHATVSAWHERAANLWMATVTTDDRKLIRSSCGPTEIDACRALLNTLHAGHHSAH